MKKIFNSLKIIGINLLGLFLFTSVLWGRDLLPYVFHIVCLLIGMLMISIQD